MNRRRLVWPTAFIIAMAGGLFAMSTDFHGQPPVSQSSPVTASAPASPRVPQRLRISKIQVDTAVQVVGLTPEGDMATPSNIVDVGWYRFGARPGDPGSAVIAGHLDGASGEPGVFVNLNQLAVGDTVEVEDKTGATTSFVVRRTHTYGAEDRPAEVFTASQGTHLNLIVCAGAWDIARQSFTSRLVVFTEAT